MNKTPDSAKLTKLHELDSLLAREIRGQSHALPRIISAVRRGELGLTKAARRAEVFCCSAQPVLEKRKPSS